MFFKKIFINKYNESKKKIRLNMAKKDRVSIGSKDKNLENCPTNKDRANKSDELFLRRRMDGLDLGDYFPTLLLLRYVPKDLHANHHSKYLKSSK
jgi:hypothetical protein